MSDLISSITETPGEKPAEIPQIPTGETVPATPAAPTPPPDKPATPAAPAEVSAEDLLSGLTEEENETVTNPTPPAPAGADVVTPPAGRKRGRPPGTKNKANFDDVAQATATPVDYKSMSEATFDLSTHVLSGTLGPEWMPANPDERAGVCKALEVYLRSKQAKDIPPGLMLTIVVVAYATPRLTQPTTKAKLFSAWLWLKSKFTRKPKN